MTDASLQNIPKGATHYANTYGHLTFYVKVRYPYLNKVSEEYEVITQWMYWDNGRDRWATVEPGFSPHRLIQLAWSPTYISGPL